MSQFRPSGSALQRKHAHRAGAAPPRVRMTGCAGIKQQANVPDSCPCAPVRGEAAQPKLVLTVRER
eukprot:8700407-Pyramimonas_sp.AAC.1